MRAPRRSRLPRGSSSIACRAVGAHAFGAVSNELEVKIEILEPPPALEQRELARDRGIAGASRDSPLPFFAGAGPRRAATGRRPRARPAARASGGVAAAALSKAIVPSGRGSRATASSRPDAHLVARQPPASCRSVPRRDLRAGFPAEPVRARHPHSDRGGQHVGIIHRETLPGERAQNWPWRQLRFFPRRAESARPPPVSGPTARNTSSEARPHDSAIKQTGVIVRGVDLGIVIDGEECFSAAVFHRSGHQPTRVRPADLEGDRPRCGCRPAVFPPAFV